jgi:hypothetical protein
MFTTNPGTSSTASVFGQNSSTAFNRPKPESSIFGSSSSSHQPAFNFGAKQPETAKGNLKWLF